MLRSRAVVRSGLLLVLALAVDAGASAGAQSPYPLSSSYIVAADGTRLAADVYLPRDLEPNERLPALLVLTRYWRGNADPGTGAWLPQSLGGTDRFFLDNGYALVKVDVRGTGASFGWRANEYGDQEVGDGHAIIEWVVNQPWSDGNVGAYGTSYTGTTAELLAASGHPALKAVIPGWSDFDVYVSPVRPYGLIATAFIQTWSTVVGWMDDNDASQLGSHVRRVDEDVDGELLAAAVAEHQNNPVVFEVARWSEYRDDEYEGHTMWHVGPTRWKEAIERSGVPMLVLVSWLDAGTIDGALARFRHFSNPQKLLILASNHGGGAHASPYLVGREPVAPASSTAEQRALRLAFFDHYLRGRANGYDELPAIRYHNLGEERYRDSEVWPPAGSAPRRFYFTRNGGLAAGAPENSSGADRYVVDFGVSTGGTNRWTTQMGGPVLGLDDRGEMDARMLTYTSEPLQSDLQVTGSPVVTVRLSSTREDGALLAYLEDVDPQGRSRYITEGGLRLVHRKPWLDPVFGDDGNLHSFRRLDAQPMVPGEVAEVSFRLWSTSVLLRQGHRIRVAIAAADAPLFDRVPAEGTPTLTVHRSARQPSFIELPVVGDR